MVIYWKKEDNETNEIHYKILNGVEVWNKNILFFGKTSLPKSNLLFDIFIILSLLDVNFETKYE